MALLTLARLAISSTRAPEKPDSEKMLTAALRMRLTVPLFFWPMNEFPFLHPERKPKFD